MNAGVIPVPDEPASSRHSWKGVGIASAVSVVLIVIAGLAMVVEPWSALARFDSEHLIPCLVGLQVTRVWGAWSASVVACLHLTALQHHGVRSRSRLRTAIVAAGSVPVLYVPVSLLALASAMILVRVWLGLSPGTFFRMLNAGDFGRGIATAIALSVVPFAWTFICEKLFSKSRRGLGAKLFITWLCMLGLSFGFSSMERVFSPPEPGIDLSSDQAQPESP